VRLRPLLPLVAALILLGLLVAGPAGAAKPRVTVLSNRADLISGGDALVAIQAPQHKSARAMKVTVNGSRLAKAVLHKRANDRVEGLVKGLRLGVNHIRVRMGPGPAGRARIVNHRNGGPIFTGAQMKPWVCQNEAAVDAQCNQPAEYQYQYMSSVTHGLEPYDPGSPPPDVATTTTDQGKTVPFIIRIETGYQDRDEYAIAVLYDPAKPWTAWSPQKQWNHKLLVTHGASCGIDHQSGSAPSVTGDTVGVPGAPSVGSSSPTTALGLGFAVMSTALDNAGHNCNLGTQAESLVMAKERLIEQYGTLRYTIGTGCSGGSLVQQQVANAYPGIYQGILPQCSFPDSWSTGQQLAAYHLIRGYVEDPSKWAPGVTWSPEDIAAIEGHPNHVNSIVFDTVYWTALADPTNPCAGVSDSERYDPDTNPGGARCTLADDMINVLGPRPPRLWTPQEKQIGHGFGAIPLSDTGVQFGLQSLLDGTITPEQFADLNDKIGGATIDLGYTPKRLDATRRSLRNAYRSGAINSTNNLKGTAIIDLRGPDPGAFHDAYRSFAIRARLEREEGHFPNNHVIWYGQAPLIGDPRYTTQGLLAMDRWLGAVEKDKRHISLQRKVASDRPKDVHDRCSSVDGVHRVSLPGVGPVCENKLAQTRFGTPAMVAGEGIATDTNRCRLKPLRRADYYPVTFTHHQWGSLKKDFPTGVCDWARPGVEQQGAIPWQTYQRNAKGSKVIYGGRPLGPAPEGSGAGWSSPAFSSWRLARRG
jgi:hypothetical protein